MAKRIFVPTNDASDWRRLLAQPETQWRDGYSAKAAAERWEASSGWPPEIAQQFELVGWGPTELLIALPEWKTPLPGGERAGQTDVFALVHTNTGVVACAVEAKVIESFDKTVREWSVSESIGKQRRLAYLCELLGLSNPPPGELRYQLLHRTAAALIEAKRFGCAGAAMIVHSFSAEKTQLKDFQAFARALGAEVGADTPVIVRPCGGMPLLLGWASGPT
ncbi:MAG: hypothetical protein KBA31_13030 [Alphaproteobacteria bacterium]|nr:hypothetical protein [Alphaproteobacteria bacterium]